MLRNIAKVIAGGVLGQTLFFFFGCEQSPSSSKVEYGAVKEGSYINLSFTAALPDDSGRISVVLCAGDKDAEAELANAKQILENMFAHLGRPVDVRTSCQATGQFFIELHGSHRDLASSEENSFAKQANLLCFGDDTNGYGGSRTGMVQATASTAAKKNSGQYYVVNCFIDPKSEYRQFIGRNYYHEFGHIFGLCDQYSDNAENTSFMGMHSSCDSVYRSAQPANSVMGLIWEVSAENPLTADDILGLKIGACRNSEVNAQWATKIPEVYQTWQQDQSLQGEIQRIGAENFIPACRASSEQNTAATVMPEAPVSNQASNPPMPAANPQILPGATFNSACGHDAYISLKSCLEREMENKCNKNAADPSDRPGGCLCQGWIIGQRICT